MVVAHLVKPFVMVSAVQRDTTVAATYAAQITVVVVPAVMQAFPAAVISAVVSIRVRRRRRHLIIVFLAERRVVPSVVHLAYNVAATLLSLEQIAGHRASINGGVEFFL